MIIAWGPAPFSYQDAYISHGGRPFVSYQDYHMLLYRFTAWLPFNDSAARPTWPVELSFVPELPHFITIIKSRALISYQDCRTISSSS